MAETTISEVYEPLTFNAAVDEKALELNAFLASGIVAPDPIITEQASAGGRIGELAYFGNLSVAEPNYSSDTVGATSTPLDIAGKKDIWRLAAINKSWSTMDLARELSLKDPLPSIVAKIGGYWATSEEDRVIQSAMGILADNDANDSDDMLVNIATDDAGATTAAELISAAAILDAKQTMGDKGSELSVIAMHSVCLNRLAQNDLITYLRDSEGNVLFPTYMGLRVVEDDSMPAVAGTNRITYTSVLFAGGAIGRGTGRVLMPSELERSPGTGNGGGQDIIHSRRSVIYHPYGFQFTSSSVAGASATLAELAAAANWDRIQARKNIGIAFLLTNG
jgi:hypothetical protein